MDFVHLMHLSYILVLIQRSCFFSEGIIIMVGELIIVGFIDLNLEIHRKLTILITE